MEGGAAAGTTVGGAIVGGATVVGAGVGTTGAAVGRAEATGVVVVAAAVAGVAVAPPPPLPPNCAVPVLPDTAVMVSCARNRHSDLRSHLQHGKPLEASVFLLSLQDMWPQIVHLKL